MLILYGSEKGNARDCAETLARRCLRLRLDIKLSALDDYGDFSNLGHGSPSDNVIVVICSTTGQGELPRNAQRFWRFMLRKKLTNDFLRSVEFCTFGLGDSSYPRYNWAVRKIHKRFLQLGAKELCARGEGDEMSPQGIEAMFETWMEVFCNHVMTKYNISPDHQISESQLLEPWMKLAVRKDRLKHMTTDVDTVALSRVTRDSSSTTCSLFEGTVRLNKRMTSADHFQDVRKISFDCSSAPEYSPGDAVEFYPCNNCDDVEALLAHQGWSDIADYPVEVSEAFEAAAQQPLVSPLTLRSLLTHHLDINSIPRRSFFGLVWHFASDSREQERLKEFSLVENVQDLYDYANRPRRSILETITEFHSLKIPVDYVLDVIPIMQPRQFSIASPASSYPIDLAVAVVKYKTIIRRIRRGVCTRWLEGLVEGTKIPFGIVRTRTKFNNSAPIIMVAPGTGVAPMRNLILTWTRQDSYNFKMMLFFGCRYADRDYLFEQDWKDIANLEVITAFSREGGGYVQNKMYDHKEQIGQLIVEQNASIYVCGSAGKMPRQVRITFATILEETQKWDANTVEEYIRQMEKIGRYLQETW